MTPEGIPQTSKPLVEREPVVAATQYEAESTVDSFREKELRAQIEELQEAIKDFHGSAETVRAMRHRLVGLKHRLEDELTTLGASSEKPHMETEAEVEVAPAPPSDEERMQELERKVLRTRGILATIPEDSRIRRAPHETLLRRYEREHELLQEKLVPAQHEPEALVGAGVEPSAPLPELHGDADAIRTELRELYEAQGDKGLPSKMRGRINAAIASRERELAQLASALEASTPVAPEEVAEELYVDAIPAIQNTDVSKETVAEDEVKVPAPEVIMHVTEEQPVTPKIEIVESRTRARSDATEQLPVEQVPQSVAFDPERLKTAKAELATLNAGFGNKEIETARRFGIDTFNRMEASDAIQRLVAEREAEIAALEHALERAGTDEQIGKIRAELKELERAYHGNDAIAVARKFGIDTFNQAEARDAIERMVQEREAHIHQLEGRSLSPEDISKQKERTPVEVMDAAPAEIVLETSEENVAQESVSAQSTADAIEKKIVEPASKENTVPVENLTLQELVATASAKEVFNTIEKKRESAEQTGNAESVRNPIDSWTERYLGSQFNISREDIESIQGFDRLNAAQQKFICENLAQLTLGAVQEDAARLVSKSVGARKSEMVQNYGRLFGGALAGAREVFTGGYTKLKTEKEVAARARSGGMSEHGALLTELVQNMANRGPRIHENAKGELIVDLLNIRERARDKSTRDAEWFAMNELNVLAHELAQTPAEWRGQTLGTLGTMGGKWKLGRFFNEKVLRTKGAVQENTYAKREEEYERAKRNLEEILRKKGDDDLKIAQTFIGLDSRVHQLQTLRTNPDAIEELSRIKDKDFFTESAKQVLSGPGVYMALGALGRTFGGAAIGFFGAPVAAGILGSVRSWNRTAAELRERDRNARAGVRDGKTGALNIVAAERAEQVVLVNGKEMQNGLTAKLMRLTEQAMQAEGAEKQRLLAQLRARVEYVHDKERLHRIEYGAASGRVTRHVALVETIGRALAYLSEEELTTSAEATERFTKTQSRLNKKLTRAEEAIIAARLKGRKSELVKSAAVAASFSVAGALIADYFRSDSMIRGASDSAITPDGSSETIAGNASSEVPASVESAPVSYTIKQGDTLWDILSQKTALAELGETRARENAVANIVKSLTSAQLQEIGITSGDARKIYPGDTINMEKLSALLKEQQSVIESARARFGQLPVDTDLADIIPAKVEK